MGVGRVILAVVAAILIIGGVASALAGGLLVVVDEGGGGGGPARPITYGIVYNCVLGAPINAASVKITKGASVVGSTTSASNGFWSWFVDPFFTYTFLFTASGYNSRSVTQSVGGSDVLINAPMIPSGQSSCSGPAPEPPQPPGGTLNATDNPPTAAPNSTPSIAGINFDVASILLIVVGVVMLLIAAVWRTG